MQHWEQNITRLRHLGKEVFQYFLSVPIYLKILGIVLCVSLLFSIVVFVQLASLKSLFELERFCLAAYSIWSMGCP